MDEHSSHTGSHQLDTVSRCGLLGLNRRGITPTPDLLAVRLWIWPRMLLCGGMLQAHVQLAAHQKPSWTFLAVLLCLLVPCTVACPLQGVFPSQVQEFTFVVVEFHKVPAGPFLLPTGIPLSDSWALKFAVTCTHKECTLTRPPGHWQRFWTGWVTGWIHPVLQFSPGIV